MSHSQSDVTCVVRLLQKVTVLLSVMYLDRKHRKYAWWGGVWTLHLDNLYQAVAIFHVTKTLPSSLFASAAQSLRCSSCISLSSWVLVSYFWIFRLVPIHYWLVRFSLISKPWSSVFFSIPHLALQHFHLIFFCIQTDEIAVRHLRTVESYLQI